MRFNVDDLRIANTRALLPPAVLLEELQSSEAENKLVHESRKVISEVVKGEDDRLLVVVGPCSIHSVEGALEYGRWLRGISDQFSDQLVIVMRAYFEKPRTVTGWKGLINDPDIDESYQINKGLRLARNLLLDLAAMGMPTAVEFLDNIIPQYFADLVSWAAVGARTSSSQIHREFASGCSMPVGFKNSTDGEVQSAIDAVRAARLPHWFPSVTKQGISAILQTSGNDTCHIILRGGYKTGPNFGPDSVAAATERLASFGLPSRVMVDCSHGNSEKNHQRQRIVAESVAEQLSGGSQRVLGVMLESNLAEGRQDLVPGIAPKIEKSITDACIGLDVTEQILGLLSESVSKRRKVIGDSKVRS